jgi:uncharacterized membrane protein
MRRFWIWVGGAAAGTIWALLTTQSSIIGGMAVGAFIGAIIERFSKAFSTDTQPEEVESLRARVQQLEAHVATLAQDLKQLQQPVQAPLSGQVSGMAPAAPTLASSVETPIQTPAPITLTSHTAPPFANTTSRVTNEHEHPAPVDFPETDFAMRAAQRVRSWLLGGNAVARIGTIVLLFGIAFLLKYAADNHLLPIEFRLAGITLGAIALLVAGWRIGARRESYGLILQGAGIGILYLTVFAAARLYHLMPAGAAFVLLAIICALSTFLAVRQNAQPLALMGNAGGFLAPVLVASGGGSHVALLSYYALLNIGIFALSWFKAWRSLNLLSFLFTFVIGTAWGIRSYHPELLSSTEPFLILFLVLYTAIALLYATRRQLDLRSAVDGTLVFGPPIAAFGLQVALMKDIPFGLAWSAVALAAYYLAIAAWLARERERFTLLFEAILALAVIFVTVAIPLAFSGPTTSAAWAIEGAAVIWLGIKQRRYLMVGFGVFMQAAAAGAFFISAPFSHPQGLPVFNSIYLSTLLIALAGLFTGWQLNGRTAARVWHDWMPTLGAAFAAWGLLWWFGGGIHEISRYAQTHPSLNPSYFKFHAALLLTVLSAWLAHIARRQLAWPLAEVPALAFPFLLALFVNAALNVPAAPLIHLGWIAWPISVISAYLLLWRQQRDFDDSILASSHTVMFWSLCGLFALQGYWQLHTYVPEGAWSWSAWAYGLGLLLVLVSCANRLLHWPVNRFMRAYQLWGAAPLAIVLGIWTFASMRSNGDAAPLMWLPILNPLDIAQLLVFFAVTVWLRRLKTLGAMNPYPDTYYPHAESYARWLGYAVPGALFLWLNVLLLRTLHHWAGLPYSFDALLRSTLVQATLSVFWTICALVLMVWATHRRPSRLLWLTGAALLTLTIVKLFLFDLSHIQGLERIVSFIGIGAILLLIGYFSPLPPKVVAAQSIENTQEE